MTKLPNGIIAECYGSFTKHPSDCDGVWRVNTINIFTILRCDTSCECASLLNTAETTDACDICFGT